MAGPNLSRFLGLFRLRDASNPARVAAVSAGGEVSTADATLAARVGEVQASPTANTVLDRLKTIGAALAGALTVQGAASVTATATIASSGNLSGVVDCGTARLAVIIMPASWTAADLTFQESVDNSTFVDKYDAYGVEYTVVSAASRAILINLADFIGARYLKVRSGTSGSPVAQGGTRALTLVLVP